MYLMCGDNSWRIESGVRRSSFRAISDKLALEHKELYERYYIDNFERNGKNLIEKKNDIYIYIIQ